MDADWNYKVVNLKATSEPRPQPKVVLIPRTRMLAGTGIYLGGEALEEEYSAALDKRAVGIRSQRMRSQRIAS